MAGAYETGVYRNIFKECGYSKKEILKLSKVRKTAYKNRKKSNEKEVLECGTRS